jgi:hypothetical protein
MIEVEKKVKYDRIAYYIKNTEIYHREDGPAIIFINAYKAWYFNGELHRDDGPAIVWDDGVLRWWLHGKWFSTKERWFEALSEEQKEKALYSEYFIKG